MSWNVSCSSHITFCRISMFIAMSDSGVHINQIKASVASQGFSESDVMKAINELSNEGHIYSTIDEQHYQYAS
jgi:DNA replicative helicase MCM subunit Mcm2 (Cdc46/Mcm family)